MACALGLLTVTGLAAGTALHLASLDNLLGKKGFGNVANYDMRPTGDHSDLVAYGSVLCSIIRTSIIEEVFFRGIIFDRFVRLGFGGRQAASVASVLFGLLHLPLPMIKMGTTILPAVVYGQAVLATILGYVYCLLVCLGDGNLVPCIILHCLNNLSAACFLTPATKEGPRATQWMQKNESPGEELSREKGMPSLEFPTSFVPIKADNFHDLRGQSIGRTCDGFGFADYNSEVFKGERHALGFPHFELIDSEMALLVIRVTFACGSMVVAIALCLRVGRLTKR